MTVQVYLLDMTGQNDDRGCEGFLKAAPKLVDDVRRCKAEKIKTVKGKVASLGAGLLLQKMVLDYQNHSQVKGVQRYTAEELVAFLQKQKEQNRLPLQLEYRFGAHGKPEIRNVSTRFSISHSGDYVLLAACDLEVGADIQQCKKTDYLNLARRFFSEEEYEALEACENEAAGQSLFYRYWTEKEAYGKMTGSGVSMVLDRNVKKRDVDWVDRLVLPGYAAAICVGRA